MKKAPVIPENDDARWQAGTRTTQNTSNTEALIDLDAERKAFATLAAKLCLAGYALHEMAHGGYVVTRWDRVFHSNDLAGVRGFAMRAGVSI